MNKNWPNDCGDDSWVLKNGSPATMGLQNWHIVVKW
jgi:hypothetical protein